MGTVMIQFIEISQIFNQINKRYFKSANFSQKLDKCHSSFSKARKNKTIFPEQQND